MLPHLLGTGPFPGYFSCLLCRVLLVPDDKWINESLSHWLSKLKSWCIDCQADGFLQFLRTEWVKLRDCCSSNWESVRFRVQWFGGTIWQRIPSDDLLNKVHQSSMYRGSTRLKWWLGRGIRTSKLTLFAILTRFVESSELFVLLENHWEQWENHYLMFLQNSTQHNSLYTCITSCIYSYTFICVIHSYCVYIHIS